MAAYSLEPTPGHQHGCFSRDLPPVLTVRPGATVDFGTLDAGWNEYGHEDPYTRPAAVSRAEALMLASMVVDLRVTREVNITKGVHALLPHGSLDACPAGHSMA